MSFVSLYSTNSNLNMVLKPFLKQKIYLIRINLKQLSNKMSICIKKKHLKITLSQGIHLLNLCQLKKIAQRLMQRMS